jgi:hypothetical protein
MRKLLTALVLCYFAVPHPAAQSVSVLDRVLPGESVFCDRLTPDCAFIALYKAGIPAGIETQHPPPPDSHQRMDVGGLTVRELLAKSLEADPSYEWRETKGVVVLRKRSAWTDSASLLNSRLQSPFVLADVDLVGAAYLIARNEADPKPREGRPFSLTLENATLLDALNAVAREQRVSWQWMAFPEQAFSGLMFLDRSGQQGASVVVTRKRSLEQ